MANEFAQLVKTAETSKWCTRIYCTTCGNGEFRKSLTAMGDGIGFRLADALAGLDINEYTTLTNWDDCLRIAFLHLPFPPQREKVLNSWLPHIDLNIRFADVVLFYIVRYVPLDDVARRGWISSCANLAVNSKDASLVESLVWVLGRNVRTYPELLQVANHLSAISLNVHKAMVASGNM